MTHPQTVRGNVTELSADSESSEFQVPAQLSIAHYPLSKVSGIYIHIPFCKRRCTYCDFYSTVGLNHVDRYIDCLIAEATMRANELPDNGRSAETLYIGGGTPSQLTLEQMQRLVTGLRNVFGFEQLKEFTVEVNPDDVTRDYVAGLVSLGVNRISMGVQSFNDAELQAIGRRHTAREAIDSLSEIRAAGIGNVSIDLIYGLPLQTLDTWRETVGQAIALRPQHISAYALSYEPGTALWRQRERGEVKEADDDLSVTMYRELIDALCQAGYEHYEISNFALPGFNSRHNSSYWNDKPYLGLGASAHSYDCKVRRYNLADIVEYIKAIEAHHTAFEIEQLTLSERYDEAVMVQLRTLRGIDLDFIESRFGLDALQHLKREAEIHINHKRLVADVHYIRLTADGIMTSDAIIRDLMW